jgi:hypothetical protein
MIRHICLLAILLIVAVTLTGCSKTYTATAYLACEGIDRDGGPGVLSPNVVERLATQANFVRGENVLQRALMAEEVRAAPWYAAHESDPLAGLREALRIEPVEGTQRIAVSVTVSDPNGAAVLANAVAYAAVEDYAARLTEHYVQQLNTLGDQRNALEEEIGSLEIEIRDLACDLPPDWDEQRAAREEELAGRVEELTARRDVMWEQVAQAEEAYRELHDLQEAGTLQIHEAVQQVLWSEQSYMQLKQEELALWNRIRRLRTSDPRPPEEELRESLDRLTVLQTEIADLEVAAGQAVLDEHEQRAREMDDEWHIITDQLDEAVTELRESVRSDPYIDILRAHLSRANAELSRVNRSIMETRLMRELDQGIRVAQEATPPTEAD